MYPFLNRMIMTENIVAAASSYLEGVGNNCLKETKQKPRKLEIKPLLDLFGQYV